MIMKKIIVLIAAMALLNGCAATQAIRQLESQQGQGVFQVIDTTAPSTPAGFGDLQISLNVKTRNTGTILIDTTSYGTERYQLLVAVNGQTQRVTGLRTNESGEYRGSTDPESGNGVRYRFVTGLRLPVGTHRISFALPGDDVVFEHEVAVKQGVNKLELKPVYHQRNRHRRIGFSGESTYYEGVKALVVAESRG
jgi:hypothetical protein